MALSSKFSTRGQVKSISLPCRSHPTTNRIEQELNESRAAATAAASKPCAETICSGLSQLTELYQCMDDLLNSSSIKLLISRQQNKNWVEELIEESVIFLDICGGLKDTVTEMREHIRDLHCTLRRRKGDSSVENSVTKYNCLRKKMRKDVKMLVGSLKQVDNMITDGGSVLVDSDKQLVAVIKAIIGVSEVTVSVFESLLLFFSVPISKPNKWSIVVSKLIHKGMVACDDQQGILNEFESIDDALQTLCKYESSNQGDKMQTAKCRLERLETQLECMETRLECMFRRLIGTRASLLNIISQ